jgi:hypothetical protein
MTSSDNNTSDAHNGSREGSAHAILAADEAHVRQAIESVEWEERGFLRRLARRDHGPSENET